MELVVLSIAVLAVSVNIFISKNAHIISSTDQSILFSFVKNHPSLNNPLVSTSDITTVLTGDKLVSNALTESAFSVVLASTQQSDDKIFHTDPTTIQDDVVFKTNPADTENFARHGLTKYEVVGGDTCESISNRFGISTDTLRLENKLATECTIKPGQELTILPTTGITYTLKNGDTMDGLMSKYKVSEDEFLDANNIESFEDLGVGAIVVIPQQSINLPAAPKPASRFVVDSTNKVALKQATAPDLSGGPVSFIWPTPVKTITQGFSSSRHTGVDISNSKMESIFAAADGFVEISGYQANGYGNTIVINHGNGFKTRYAHASALYVQAGDTVTQGQVIGKIGKSGRVRGATGIHLHFEIMKSGTRVNPLSYVKP